MHQVLAQTKELIHNVEQDKWVCDERSDNQSETVNMHSILAAKSHVPSGEVGSGKLANPVYGRLSNMWETGWVMGVHANIPRLCLEDTFC